MSMAAEKLVTDALNLPLQVRAFVAEKLIESLDVDPVSDISPSWRDEIRKRCREIDAGTVELRDAEDVFAKAYAALG